MHEHMLWMPLLPTDSGNNSCLLASPTVTYSTEMFNKSQYNLSYTTQVLTVLEKWE